METKQPPQVQAFQEHGLGQTGKFQKSPAGLGLELDPHQQQVSDQGGPDLDQHRILGGSVKGLNFQVLLDPLEKEFNLPAAAVKFGHLQGGQVQAVGQKDIFLAVLRVPIGHPGTARNNPGRPGQRSTDRPARNASLGQLGGHGSCRR